MSISPVVFRAVSWRSASYLSGRCVIGPVVLALCGVIGCEAPELPASARAPEAANSQAAPAAAPELPPEAPAAAPEATRGSDIATAPVEDRGTGEAVPPAAAPVESA